MLCILNFNALPPISSFICFHLQTITKVLEIKNLIIRKHKNSATEINDYFTIFSVRK